MLTIQNNGQTFQGKFIRNEILEKRINELSSPDKLNKLYESLKQIDAQKDGKIYKYAEKTIEEDKFVDIVESTFAYITDEKGGTLKKMLMRSKSAYKNANRNSVSHKSISDLICDFAKERYPKKIDTEKTRNNILEILG